MVPKKLARLWAALVSAVLLFTLASVFHLNGSGSEETVGSSSDDFGPPNYHTQARDPNLNQIMFLDYLHGEGERNSKKKLFGGSLKKRNFDILTAWHSLDSQTRSIDFNSNSAENIIQLLRTLYISHRVLLDTPREAVSKLAVRVLSSNKSIKNESMAVEYFESQVSQTMQNISDAVLPWISTSFDDIFHMHRSYRSASDGEAGYVMLASTNLYYRSLHLIRVLRREFNSSLPIHVYYNGTQSLEPTMVYTLSGLFNVKVVNLHHWFRPEHLPSRTAQLKPFMILANSMLQVIVLDPRARFLKSPVALLKMKEFETTGQLYFHDFGVPKRTSWTMLPEAGLTTHMSLHGRSLMASHTEPLEITGGVLAVSKYETSVFYSLLLAATFNSKQATWTFPAMAKYAEENSFWLASEALRVPYSFASGPVGAIGVQAKTSRDSEPALCRAHKLHSDDRRYPYWWISNSQEDAFESFPASLEIPTHVALTQQSHFISWEETENYGLCASKLHNFIRPLNWTESLIVKRSRTIFSEEVEKVPAFSIDEAQIRFLDFYESLETGLLSGRSFHHLTQSDLSNTWLLVNSFTQYLAKRNPITEIDRDDFFQAENFIRAVRSLYILYRVQMWSSPALFTELSASAFSFSKPVIYEEPGEKRDPGDVLAWKHLQAQTKASLTYLSDIVLPWMNPMFKSIVEMRRDYSLATDGETGIVMLCDDKKFSSALNLIQILQSEFNISLPIVVYYNGTATLQSIKISILHSLDNVTPVNLREKLVIGNHTINEAHLTPYMILANTFRTVILLDSNVRMMKSPLQMLRTEDFLRTKQYYYLERTGVSERRIDDIRDAEVIAHLTRDFSFKAPLEMSREVMVVDKSKVSTYFSLVLAATLSSKSVNWTSTAISDYITENSFWFASEALRAPYSFASSKIGALGVRPKPFDPDQNSLCYAFKMYTDEKEEILWWSGDHSKKPTNDVFNSLSRTHALLIGSERESTWFESEEKGLCLNSPNSIPTPLPSTQELMLERFHIIHEDVEKLGSFDVDLTQMRLLDFMNGEAELDRNVFGGSLQNMTILNVTEAWQNATWFSQYVVNRPNYCKLDFGDIGRRTRTLYLSYKLYNEPKYTSLLTTLSRGYKPLLHVNSTLVTTLREELNYTIQNLTATLFPWINPPFPTIQQMHQTFLKSKDQTGIAISGGSKHYYMIRHLIITLRREFKIDLPIEVFYVGEDDMEPEMIHSLQKMPKVTTVNLLGFFPLETKFHYWWSLKPFVILASRFRTVLFIDADVTFFRNPLEALDTDIYKRTGSIFYRDRLIRDENRLIGAEWFHNVNPHMSSYGLKNVGLIRSVANLSAGTNEMDSGFMPFDKGNLGVLFSLLLTAKMNSHEERQTLYNYTHGDKESFWLSREMLRVPYAFSEAYGGSVGISKKVKAKNKEGYVQVCGQTLLHVNEDGDSFWANGGGVLKEQWITMDFHKSFATLTHAISDQDGMADWKPGYCCMKPAKDSMGRVTARELNDKEKALLERYRQIYRSEIKEMGSFFHKMKKRVVKALLARRPEVDKNVVDEDGNWMLNVLGSVLLVVLYGFIFALLCLALTAIVPKKLDFGRYLKDL
ncbi:hypothetical protein HDU81_009315 [Chytriomyces hyalinus]|nr:hypothetical protein HDU81_009315 [Chytriomyces hyalinus]